MTHTTPHLGDTFMEKVLTIAPPIIYVFNQITQANEYSNRSLGESIGYTPEEVRALGDALMPTLAHPDDLPKIGDHFAALSDAPDGDVLEILYRMRHRDGRWVWLLSYDTVFEREDDGRVRSHVGVATDITARIEAQREVQRVNDRLVAANEELAELAYVVSHDMRAPVVNIAELARAIDANLPADDEDSRTMIELILRSCSQAEHRIEAVVAVTQSRETLLSTPGGDAGLRDAIDAAVAELAPMISATDASIRIDIGEHQVPVPGIALQSLFANLFANAMTHRHDDRSPEIHVTSSVTADHITVEVLDNGIGVGPADRERVFGLFQRGANTTRDGSGVGLYLIRQMMRRAGGEATIGDPPDTGGTRLVLTFPGDADG